MMGRGRHSSRRGPTPATPGSSTPSPHPTLAPPDEQPQSEGEQPQSQITTYANNRSGRKRVWIDDEGKFVNSSKVARRCKNIMELLLVAEGWKWSKVPKSVRQDYWDEFKKYYWWPEDEEARVKKAFFKKMRKRYSGNLCRWRKNDKPPDGCSQAVWKAWKVKWASEDFKKVSAKQKANRASERGGTSNGPSRHTAGSRSMADHARAFEEEHGRRPSKIELFDATHKTRLADGTRIYIDNRAKTIGEALKKKKHDFLYASDGTSRVDSEGKPTVLTTEIEDQLFMETAIEDLSEEDGRTHRYLYGTGGNKENSVRSDGSTSLIVAPQIQKMAEEIHSLKQTMADKDAAATEKEKAWEAKYTKMEKLVMALMEKTGLPPSSPTSEP